MTDVWAPSPSPSLDAFESTSSTASVLLVGWHVASTLPSRLWDAYVAYLWSYQPSSWVGRVASSFRILAIILVLPVVLLTLLDVTSYVIVRTLGVVEDVKASTSDAHTIADSDRSNAVAVETPAIAVVPTLCRCESEEASLSSSSPRDAEGRLAPEGDGVLGRLRVRACEPERVCGGTPVQVGGGAHRGLGLALGQNRQMGVGFGLADRGGGEGEGGSDASPRAYYFAGDADLRLAGEGVFSPAVSMPPSPLTPHLPMYALGEGDGRSSGQASEEEGIMLRRRVQGVRGDTLRS